LPQLTSALLLTVLIGWVVLEQVALVLMNRRAQTGSHLSTLPRETALLYVAIALSSIWLLETLGAKEYYLISIAAMVMFSRVIYIFWMTRELVWCKSASRQIAYASIALIGIAFVLTLNDCYSGME